MTQTGRIQQKTGRNLVSSAALLDGRLRQDRDRTMARMNDAMAMARKADVNDDAANERRKWQGCE